MRITIMATTHGDHDEHDVSFLASVVIIVILRGKLAGSDRICGQDNPCLQVKILIIMMRRGEDLCVGYIL